MSVIVNAVEFSKLLKLLDSGCDEKSNFGFDHALFRDGFTCKTDFVSVQSGLVKKCLGYRRIWSTRDEVLYRGRRDSNSSQTLKQLLMVTIRALVNKQRFQTLYR